MQIKEKLKLMKAIKEANAARIKRHAEHKA